jgi:hypothetical protein
MAIRNLMQDSMLEDGGMSLDDLLMQIQQLQPAQPVQETKPSASVIDTLTKQILGSSDTSKWTGGVGAEQAAKDMAKIMAGIGITDISQFGKITQTGLQEDVRPDGRGGYVDQRGNPVDPNIVQTGSYETEGGRIDYATAPIGTQVTYGNKETNQAVPITYSERQTGNAFGGTFEGKGNTGYRVDFDASGKPVFYTTGASSRDDIGVFAPIIAAALTPILGPAAASLLGPTASTLATNALTGALVGGSTSAITGDSIAKGALLGGAGGAVADIVSPYLPSAPTELTERQFAIADAKQLAASGIPPEQISEILSVGGYNDAIVNRAMDAIATAPVAVTTPTTQPPIETVQVSAPVATTPTASQVINAIAQIPVEQPPVQQVRTPVEVTAPREEAPKVETPQTVQQVIASIIPELVMTSQAPKEPEQPIPTIVAPPIQETIPQITTIAERPSTITNETEPAPVIVAPPITGTVPPKTYTASEIIDMIRLGVLGASVLGAANQETGPTGFPIVPVPAEWQSPTYAKNLPTTAPTQLPPIDFGNRNLLIGTQWEKFLDPNYGKVPAPIQFNQPSNMSYNQLRNILGTSRDVLPSQVLSINDVISGIQNQYGQTPTGSMG